MDQITVATLDDLNSAIAAANALTQGSLTISFAGDIDLSGTAVAALDLQDGVSLAIDGGGHTLDGGGTQEGFFEEAGNVTIENLSIVNATARGGDAPRSFEGNEGQTDVSGGGGGGAGLGGGVFVASGASMSLVDVDFTHDSAVGGSGASDFGLAGGLLDGRTDDGALDGYGDGAVSGTDGGFGGGGGAGRQQGGFGAGAGGYSPTTTPPLGAGGGGLGAGADVFVEENGSLTIVGGNLGLGTVQGGPGTTYLQTMASSPGAGLGSGVFMQGGTPLTIAAVTGGTTTVSGAIVDEEGSGSVVVGDLSGVDDGTVVFGAGNAYGSTTVLSGTLEVQAGAMEGDVRLSAATTLLLDDAATGTGSSISGTGQVIDDVAGTVTLQGDNTYTGGTTVTQGILQVGTGGADGALDGDVSLSGAGSQLVVDASGSSMLAGTISGAGSLVETGGGTLTVSGHNTFSGGVTLTSGTLVAASSTAIGSGAFTFGTAVGNVLAIGSGVGFSDTIRGYQAGETIDLQEFGTATGAKLLAGNVLEVDGSAAPEMLQLDPARDYSNQEFLTHLDGAGGSDVEAVTLSYTVSTETQLNAALSEIALSSQFLPAGQAITLNLATGAYFQMDASLEAVNVRGGSLVIKGNGDTIDGGGLYRGLFAYSGTITVQDLSIINTVAYGGNAGGAIEGTSIDGEDGGGGGGAGLGGGLFVAGTANGGDAPASVTLLDVSFSNDTAIGGAGGAYYNGQASGGGGLGGTGDIGGGGIGGSYFGDGYGVEIDQQDGTDVASGAGIVPYSGTAADGGSDGYEIFAGGVDGGGGGGSEDENRLGYSGAGGGIGGTSGGQETSVGQSEYAQGGNGGFGGGGGADDLGGTGGFGGGGGAGLVGGNGGFGGGAGVGIQGTDGVAGFGGGSTYKAYGVSRGGEGLAAGGDVFVQEGGSLTVEGSTLSKEAFEPTGGTPTAGGEFGDAIFLQGDQDIVFGGAGPEPVTIGGDIADQSGSGGTGANAGAGRVTIAQGTTTFEAATTYTGGTLIEAGGTLELVAGATAGAPGSVLTFAGLGASLQVDAGATYYAATGMLTVRDGTSYAVVLPTGAVMSQTQIAGGAAVFKAALVAAPDNTAPYVTASLVSDTGASASDLVTSDPTLHGGGDAGATVTISEGGVALGTAAAGPDGTWTYKPSVADGVHTFTATETDAAGNVGTAAITLTQDTTPPAPTAQVADDTQVPGDGITSDPTLTGTADAGDTITVLDGTTVLGTTTAGADGAWTYDPVLADGSYSLTVSATDIAGNTGSTTLDFVKARPALETAQGLNAAILAADSLTSGTATITLAGDISLDNSVDGSVDLDAIDLHSGVSLVIDGAGYTIDGAGVQRGFFAYSGNVTIENVTLANMLAAGGTGQDGGGGAGLGGGLFVAGTGNGGAAPAAVTLIDVDFKGDAAQGGAGSRSESDPPSGGGGLGGAGGESDGLDGGAGGGVGLASAIDANGAVGIVPGAGSSGGGRLPGSYVDGDEGVGGAGGGIYADPAQAVSATLDGAAGGFGGGGGASGDTYEGVNGNGGDGGFGGGGGGGFLYGGNGGFGGGGGNFSEPYDADGNYGSSGAAGFGAGAGALGESGGGLGAGGDVFVQQGGSLTVVGGSVANGTVAGGQNASDTRLDGSAYGAGVFLQGDQSIAFAAQAGQVQTVAGVIADEDGSGWNSHPYVPYSGSGSVVIGDAQGDTGTVRLTASSSYSGGTTVDAGATLELASGARAGSGAITLAGTGSSLLLDAGATYNATTATLSVGDGSLYAMTAAPTGTHFSVTQGAVSTSVTDVSDAIAAALESDTGSSATDGITRSDTLAGSSAIGAVVTVSEGAAVLGTTTADSNGAWSYTPDLADGIHTLTVTQDAMAGSATVAFDLDTVAPAPTAFLVADTGASASDGLTREAELQGQADPSVPVLVLDGTTLLGTATPDSSGAWNFTPVLADGSYMLTVRQTDAAGNMGSASVGITLDTAAPALTAVLADDTGASSQDGITADAAIMGTTQAGATVAVSDGTTVLGSPAVGAAGGWSFTPTLPDGSYDLTVTSTDLAGNATQVSVPFVLQAAVPAAPAISAPARVTLMPSGGSNVSAVSLSDAADNADMGYQVTLSSKAGTLSASGSGVTVLGTSGLSIAGTLAQVNQDLATLQDRGASGTDDVIQISATASDLAGGQSTAATSATEVDFRADPVAVHGVTLASQSPDRDIKTGQPFSFTLSATDFADTDGSLGYSVSGHGGVALPSWLSFDAATRTFSGTAPATASVTGVVVRATGSDGTSSAEEFHVYASGDTPVLQVQAPDVRLTGYAAFSFTLPQDSYSVPGGGTLAYSASQVDGSALPSWISFDAATSTFSGVTPSGAASVQAVKVVATAQDGSQSAEAFHIYTASSGLTLTQQQDDVRVSGGQGVAFTLAPDSFTDRIGGQIAYKVSQADGAALPSWLTFDAATGAFSGTAPASTTDVLIRVDATGPSGGSSYEAFHVYDKAAAPVFELQTPDLFAARGQGTMSIPASTFQAPAGQSLTYTATQDDGSALPSWVAFDPSALTFTVSGHDTPDVLKAVVAATTAQGGTSAEAFHIYTDYGAPTVQSAQGDVTLSPDVSGGTFSQTVPGTSFSDPASQSPNYTYAATQTDGTALPSWMQLSTDQAGDAVFSGTAPVNPATLGLVLTATSKTSGLAVHESFRFLDPGSDQPQLASQTPDQFLAAGGTYDVALPASIFTVPDGASLSYAATQTDGTALPSWVQFAAPAGGAAGDLHAVVPAGAQSLDVTLGATTPGGHAASETFSLKVT